MIDSTSQTPSTKKRSRRRVLVFPGDGRYKDDDNNENENDNDNNDDDFAIDEDDFHAVHRLLLVSGIPQQLIRIPRTKMDRKLVHGEERRAHTLVSQNSMVEIQMRENDEELRVCVLRMAFSAVLSLSACIGTLDNLIHLDLENSSITSLPPSIARLKNVKVLNLIRTSRLVNLPEEIGELAGLNKLNLARSALGSLTPSIGCLKSLKDLDLSNTKNLTNLPEEIGDLTSLIKLNLDGSKITSLPPSIGRLTNLEDLRLFHARFPNLPEEIGHLASLKKLGLQFSYIESLPASIGRLKNLTQLELAGTDNLSNLPEEIGDLAGLKYLCLYDSWITSLPPSIGRLRNLEYLNLSCTYKLSRLPEEIGNLANLKRLYLHKSRITLLPPSIKRLQNLKELRLSCEANTVLRLPEEILSLTNNLTYSLSALRLFGNCFDDCPMAQKLLYAMTRNLARSRIGIGFGASDEDFGSASVLVPPRLWPLVLHNAKEAFAIPIETQNSYFRDIQQSDAIYQLLADERESFIGMLVNREPTDTNIRPGRRRPLEG